MALLEQISLRNRLLQALSPVEFASLAPHLERVSLPKGKVLIERNEAIEHVYFPEAGVGSVVAMAPENRKVEVGLLGWDGLVGPSVVLGVLHTPHQSCMQVEGFGHRIASAHVTRAIADSRSLHGLLLRYVQAFGIQVAATAASNGDSVIGQRHARWLLMCHDRVEGDELPLTHVFLSVMLAVRRAGVTEALHLLEGADIIEARRGVITILDRERLEETAGDSYGEPESEYEKLIPKPGSPGADHHRLVSGHEG